MTDTPAAPISMDGREGPFKGTVHLGWLHTVGHPVDGIYTPIRLDPDTLEPGMYWIVMTGSMWGFVEDDVMHLELGPNTIYGVEKVWASGTRGPQGVYDDEWDAFVHEYPIFPIRLT